MHGPQCWKLRVVCIIQVKSAWIWLTIRLDLESLESSLFTTLHLQNGRIDHLIP